MMMMLYSSSVDYEYYVLTDKDDTKNHIPYCCILIAYHWHLTVVNVTTIIDSFVVDVIIIVILVKCNAITCTSH
jgi:hypothetical protein